METLKEQILEHLKLMGAILPRDCRYRDWSVKEVELALKELVHTDEIRDNYFTLYRFVGDDSSIPFCTFSADNIVGCCNYRKLPGIPKDSTQHMLMIQLPDVNFTEKIKFGENLLERFEFSINIPSANLYTSSMSLTDSEYEDLVGFLTRQGRYDILIKLNS